MSIKHQTEIRELKARMDKLEAKVDKLKGMVVKPKIAVSDLPLENAIPAPVKKKRRTKSEMGLATEKPAKNSKAEGSDI